MYDMWNRYVFCWSYYSLNWGEFSRVQSAHGLEIIQGVHNQQDLEFCNFSKMATVFLREDICGYLVEREARGARSLVLTGHA